MLDSAMRRLIGPGLDRAGRALAARGITAGQATLAGLGLGMVAALVIAAGGPGWAALIPLALCRIADGLDGAIARATGKTGFGGLLDIVCDFAFYGAVPLAFAIRDPANALPAAFLLASFYVNAATFLGFAAIAAARGMETRAQGEKAFYYAAGLLEGTETILFFTAFCLWPGAFPWLASVFGALCLVTALARIAGARQQLAGEGG